MRVPLIASSLLLCLLVSLAAGSAYSQEATPMTVSASVGAGAPRLAAAEFGVKMAPVTLFFGASWRLGPQAGVHSFAMVGGGARLGLAQDWAALALRLERGVSAMDETQNDGGTYTVEQPTTVGTQLDIRLGFPPSRWWLGVGAEVVLWREGPGSNARRWTNELAVAPMMQLRWEWTSSPAASP